VEEWACLAAGLAQELGDDRRGQPTEGSP